jgi:hypothetical protein
MKRQRNDWRNDWRIVLLASAICASVYVLHPGVARAVGPQEPPTAGRDFGLGVVIGDPTGLSGEKWLGQRTALDFSAAWSLESNESMELAMDHVWYDFDAIETDDHRMALHYGLGGRVQFVDSGNDHAGIRFPVGLTYFADRGRVGIFMQVAPTLDLAPSTDMDLQGGLGMRYFLP